MAGRPSALCRSSGLPPWGESAEKRSTVRPVSAQAATNTFRSEVSDDPGAVCLRRLEPIVHAMEDVAIASGIPYFPPSSPLAIDLGIALVVWSHHAAESVRPRWLSFHARPWCEEIVMKRHEARGLTIVMIDAVFVRRPDQLRDAWLWLHRRPVESTSREEE